MKVDGRIISGNFRVKSKVDFLIDILMQFFLKGNWIQIHMVYLFLTLQSRLFQNSSDPDVTPNIIYLLLLLLLLLLFTPCSNRPANVQVPVKWVEVVERSQIVTPSLPPPFPCCPVNRECSWKKTQIGKKRYFFSVINQKTYAVRVSYCQNSDIRGVSVALL